MATACNVRKHIRTETGERLLVKNKISLKTSEKLRFAERSALLYELESGYKQKPNTRNFFFGYTRLWRFYHFQNRNSKFARWILKRQSEPPVLYDTILTRKTVTNLKNYLYRRGYLHATATAHTDTINKYKVQVRYTAHTGPRYHIGTVTYNTRDTAVQRFLAETKGQTNLEAQAPLQGDVFDRERQRIVSGMRNRGYADFGPNFVEFLGDSTSRVANVAVRILSPTDSTFHKKYYVGTVSVFYNLLPDYTALQQDLRLEGIYFASADPDFEVKPERILPAILVRSGQVFRQEALERTRRNLNALGVFQFVTVKWIQDSVVNNLLNVEISFAKNKRFSPEADIDFNSSNSSGSAVTPQLFGISASTGFRNRNTFGGAEEWRTNLVYNIEFDLSKARQQPVYSQEFQFQNGLRFPRFFDYLHFWRSLTRLHLGGRALVGPYLYEKLRTEASTQIGLNYNYLSLNNLYAYNSTNANYGFKLQVTNQSYEINHIGINLLRPKLEPLFDSLTRRNLFLRNNFRNQLFTGFLLRSIAYRFNTPTNGFGERWFFNADGELSGIEIHALNQLWSAVFKPQTWRIADIEFARFARLDINGGYMRDFRAGYGIATRIGAGVVLPFGPSQELPYVKQFSVGGPAGLRGWRVRELGPGSYVPAEQFQPFYQAADFRFEANAELRFPLFSYFKGAIFLDAGNIWTLRADASRPGSQLRTDSYKNIAVNTGAGFRLDVGYFVIRLDLGLKLRRPFPDEKGDYWIYDSIARLRKISLNNLNPNLAVGYPF